MDLLFEGSARCPAAMSPVTKLYIEFRQTDSPLVAAAPRFNGGQRPRPATKIRPEHLRRLPVLLIHRLSRTRPDGSSEM